MTESTYSNHNIDYGLSYKILINGFKFTAKRKALTDITYYLLSKKAELIFFLVQEHAY